MMDLATIVDLNRQRTNAARRAKRQPYVFTTADVDALRAGLVKPFSHIPPLGDYVPKGWKHVKTYFVDSSGLGRKGEAALTQWELAELITQNDPRHGYGINEVGQFQIYIYEYAPKQHKGKQ